MTNSCMNPNRGSSSNDANASEPCSAPKDTAMLQTEKRVNGRSPFDHEDGQLVAGRYCLGEGMNLGMDTRHDLSPYASSVAGMKLKDDFSASNLFSHLAFHHPGMVPSGKVTDDGDHAMEMDSVNVQPMQQDVESSSASATGESANWKVWPHMEEVFLIGCVCTRFFARGSLTSNVRAGEDCWDTIKGNYDSAWQLYLRRNPHVARPQPRTKQALKRHYKVMKERITRKGQREMNFRPFFKEFERLRLLELFLEQPDRD